MPPGARVWIAMGQTDMRKGMQAQFLERPVRTRPDSEIAPLLDLVRQEIHRPWTIALMAKHVHGISVSGN